jgi:predicted DCC family thiol-disulfide oxidoreductase YuxK
VRGYTKSTAVLRTLKLLGPPLAVLYVFILVPRFIRDGVYDLVARHRLRLFGGAKRIVTRGLHWLTSELNLRTFGTHRSR